MSLTIKPIQCRPLLNIEDRQVEYTPRPGAYAIILNGQQQLLTIKEPTGIFLPGGGQDEGESLPQTLRRELEEELSVFGEPVAYLLAADDCRYSPIYQQQFHIQSHYILTQIPDAAVLTAEDRSQIQWLDLCQAAEIMTRESDKWLCQSLINDFRLVRASLDAKALKNQYPAAVFWQNSLASSWHEVEYVLLANEQPVAPGLVDGSKLDPDQILAWIRLSLAPGEYEVRGLYLSTIGQARRLQNELQERFKGISITDPGGLFVL